MSQKLKLFNKVYNILDAIEYITLADSFVKNKIGTGHGEAKLYVGNENEKLFDFFGDFNGQCFFCKKDIKTFLNDAESEYKNPQQNYANQNMPQRYLDILSKLNEFNEDILFFQLYRVPVEPPRVYVNSNSKYYSLMREIGLPNISYISVLKLQDKNNNIFYYFKIFIDYKSDIVPYAFPEEKEAEQKIEDSAISTKKKQTLINARVGQGEYRNKLLEECPFCPFTQVNDERLLIASHIKPWAKSNDKEKVDPKNGFIFTPTFDKLFDKGFITFNSDKTIVVSPWLSPMNQKRLGIYTGKSVPPLPLCDKRLNYLEYHKKFIFKG